MSAGAGVLRELVAKIGYESDRNGFELARQNIQRLKQELGQLEGVARRASGAVRGATGGAGGGALGRGGGGFAPSSGGGGGGSSGASPAAQASLMSRLALKARGAYITVFGAGASRNEMLAGRALSTAQRGGGGFAASAAGRSGAGGGVLGSMGGALLGLGVGSALAGITRQMVSFASAANETDNVLEQVFGREGEQRVKGWAAVTGAEVGRSKYTLRDYAGQLGAMLEPMTGSSEKAEVMSKNLAKLSVDLASFFNTADNDALLALKSGIAGEVEPLRRYGIVLLDATLQEFARTQGIHKKITAMTVAEKTELRYQYIMAKTTKVQGDAARTATGFANASRALKDAWKDLITNGGQRLLPVVGKLIVWARDAISLFGQVAEKSHIVEGSIAALGAAVVVAAGTMSAAFVVPALLIAGLALAIDEIITMLNGGQTLFGEWLDKNFGVGTTDRIVQGIRDFQKAVPDVKAAWEVWSGAIDDAAERLSKFLNLLAEVPVKTLKLITGYGTFYGRDEAAGKLADSGDLSGYYGYRDDQQATRGVEGRALSVDEEMAQKRADRERNIKADAEQRKLEQRLHEENLAGGSQTFPLSGGGPTSDILFGRARVLAPSSAAAGGGGGGATVINMTNNTTVNVGGGGQREAKQVANEVDKMHRKALDAVKRTVK